MAEQNYLPPEYQAGLDEARIRELLALQLSKQQQPVGGQMVSGFYVKPSNLQYLSNTIGSTMANRSALQAQALRQQVMQKFLRDQQQAREQVVAAASPQQRELAGPPAEGEQMGVETIPPNLMKAARMAQASPFPDVQGLAKTLDEQRMKLFEEASKTASSESVRQGALAGGDPRSLRPSGWSPIKVQDVPGVGVFGVSQSDRGQQNIQGIQKPADVPGMKWGREEISSGIKQLEKTRPDVLPAQRLQPTLLEAYRLVKSGAMNTGALANEITGLQALASRIPGLAAPTAVPATQYFRNILIPALASTLKDVRGVGAQSNAELQVAMQAAIQANQDPRAIEAMLIHAMRGTQMALTEYNTMVKSLEDLAPTADVDPRFVSRLGVAGGFAGMKEDEFNSFFMNPATAPLTQPAPGRAPQQQPRRLHAPEPWKGP